MRKKEEEDIELLALSFLHFEKDQWHFRSSFCIRTAKPICLQAFCMALLWLYCELFLHHMYRVPGLYLLHPYLRSTDRPPTTRMRTVRPSPVLASMTNGSNSLTIDHE